MKEELLKQALKGTELENVPIINVDLKKGKIINSTKTSSEETKAVSTETLKYRDMIIEIARNNKNCFIIFIEDYVPRANEKLPNFNIIALAIKNGKLASIYKQNYFNTETLIGGIFTIVPQKIEPSFVEQLFPITPPCFYEATRDGFRRFLTPDSNEKWREYRNIANDFFNDIIPHDKNNSPLGYLAPLMGMMCKLKPDKFMDIARELEPEE
jgi:hypothetical protein